MASDPGELRASRGDGSSGQIEEVIKCILSEFSYISLERIHNLAFLVEIEHFREAGERLTEAEYSPFLDGFYSDEVESTLVSLDSVNLKDVRIGGDSVETAIVEGDIDCDLESKTHDLIEDIAHEYGEISQDEMMETVRSTPYYHQTTIGEKVDFS